MPRTFNSLAEFFEALPGAIDRALERAANDIAIDVQVKAQDRLGEYHPGWAPLAPSTIAERVQLGFSPEEPLLRTGGLRLSTQQTVDKTAHGYTAVVGSNAPQARSMELGQSPNAGMPWRGPIPPRPYLAPAVVDLEDEIQKTVAESIVDEIRKL